MNPSEKRSAVLEHCRTEPVDAQRYCDGCRAPGHYAEDCPKKRRRLELDSRTRRESKGGAR